MGYEETSRKVLVHHDIVDDGNDRQCRDVWYCLASTASQRLFWFLCLVLSEHDAEYR